VAEKGASKSSKKVMKLVSFNAQKNINETVTNIDISIDNNSVRSFTNHGPQVEITPSSSFSSTPSPNICSFYAHLMLILRPLHPPHSHTHKTLHHSQHLPFTIQRDLRRIDQCFNPTLPTILNHPQKQILSHSM
jgi:hypothetical protein